MSLGLATMSDISACVGPGLTGTPSGGVELQVSSLHPHPISRDKIDIPFHHQVTNLDTGIDQREVKQLVTSLFNECVTVTSVQVYRMEGGSVGVIVKVSIKYLVPAGAGALMFCV